MFRPTAAAVSGTAAFVAARDQLDRLVSRIVLYPDPLLAQILTASTSAHCVTCGIGRCTI
jgi:hypothetical protein